jgi:hypothetical protein
MYVTGTTRLGMIDTPGAKKVVIVVVKPVGRRRDGRVLGTRHVEKVSVVHQRTIGLEIGWWPSRGAGNRVKL